MNKYNFNDEIKTKLKGFKTYLQELGNSEETIRQKSNYAGYFLNWLETENLRQEETPVQRFIEFYRPLQPGGEKQKTHQQQTVQHPKLLRLFKIRES